MQYQLAAMDRPKLRALDVLSYSDSDFDRALRDIMPSSRNAVTYIDLQGWTELPEPDKLRVKDMIKCIALASSLF